MIRCLFKVYYVAVVSISLVGCATQGVLDKVPSREIDRPYTLPYGVKSWGIDAGFWNEADDPDTTNEESAGRMAVNPFMWEVPVNDSLSVLWWPLPLGFKWQVFKDETDRLGISAVTALFISAGEIAYRHSFYKNHGVELSFNALNYDLIFMEGETRKVRLGYLFQFRDNQYVKIGGGPGVLKGDSDFIDSLFSGVGVTTDSEYEVKIMTYDIGWGYRISEQWNLDLGYSVEVAQENISGTTSSLSGQKSGMGSLSIRHFW